MAIGKWIGGVLGAFAAGPIGAFVGFCLGSVVDMFVDQDVTTQTTIHTKQEERNGFLFSMMLLAANMIQADGKIMHSEMDYMRRFLRNNFGEAAERQGEQILLRLFEYKKQYGEADWHMRIMESCAQMTRLMPIDFRYQLVSFLAGLAKADGQVHASEVAVLKEMAAALGVSENDVNQLLSLGENSLEESYKTLGITSDATDEEVRKAYRKMALQYHPDKVATLGDDVKEAAKRKFQEINEAKERVYKSRGMQK